MHFDGHVTMLVLRQRAQCCGWIFQLVKLEILLSDSTQRQNTMGLTRISSCSSKTFFYGFTQKINNKKKNNKPKDFYDNGICYPVSCTKAHLSIPEWTSPSKAHTSITLIKFRCKKPAWLGLGNDC